MTTIAHVTSAHPCDDARIFHRECGSLSALGYDVVLVCSGDSSRVAENGVRLLGVRVPAGRLGRMTVGAWRCMWVALGTGARIIHIHDSELLLPALFARASGRIVVYDVHEDLPLQVMSKYWIPTWFRPVVASAAGAFEGLLATAMNASVIADPSVEERMLNTGSVTLVQNFPPAEEMSGVRDIRPGDPLRFLYVGGISEPRGIRVLLEATRIARQSVDLRLVLAGHFWPPELQFELEHDEAWEHVEFLGWLDRPGISKVMADSDVGMVILRPEPNYIEAYPTKLFEYMLAGLPVIASDFPLWRRIVQDAQAGVLVDPLSPDDVAEAMVHLSEQSELRNAMGTHGRESVLAKYTWETQARRLEALYAELLAKKGAPR